MRIFCATLSVFFTASRPGARGVGAPIHNEKGGADFEPLDGIKMPFNPERITLPLYVLIYDGSYPSRCTRRSRFTTWCRLYDVSYRFPVSYRSKGPDFWNVPVATFGGRWPAGARATAAIGALSGLMAHGRGAGAWCPGGGCPPPVGVALGGARQQCSMVAATRRSPSAA